jgi:hypothetical protein
LVGVYTVLIPPGDYEGFDQLSPPDWDVRREPRPDALAQLGIKGQRQDGLRDPLRVCGISEVLKGGAFHDGREFFGVDGRAVGNCISERDEFVGTAF